MKNKNTKVLNLIQDFVCFPILRLMHATTEILSNNLPGKNDLFFERSAGSM